jgi:hypothetical protein
MSQTGCPICESSWVEADGSAACAFCGFEEPAEFRCVKGHYVCEDCRSGDPREVVAKICDRSRGTDPVALLNLVTALDVFRRHGPQFHFVVGPVLAAVLRNRGLLKVSLEDLQKMVGRLSEIPALSCAEIGVCGAAAGAGAVVSLLNGATPTSDQERRVVLEASAQALLSITAHPGGRCCRQSVLATLETTWKFFQTHFQLPLGPIEVFCRYFSHVNDCKKDCPYHG